MDIVRALCAVWPIVLVDLVGVVLVVLVLLAERADADQPTGAEPITAVIPAVTDTPPVEVAAGPPVSADAVGRSSTCRPLPGRRWAAGHRAGHRAVAR